MQLIDADTLLLYCLNRYNKTIIPSDIINFPKLKLKVVFCKDCASGKGSTHKVCPLYKQGLMKDDDFCSKGEGKDND